MTVTHGIYRTQQAQFFKKHSDANWTVETSPMDEYGTYYKNYYFDDGAVWSERMSVEYVQQEIEVKFVKMTVEVKMLRTEFWSTESKSKFYYEKY